jgi:hypothetical protein
VFQVAANHSPNYYELMALPPTASDQMIRRRYRDLSRLYHPDTTELSAAIAVQKFQQINQAYATLSSPEKRWAYDQSIGYARAAVIRSMPSLRTTPATQNRDHSAYLDPSDRPLSSGELFALFSLGVTIVACLLLAIVIGWSRPDQGLSPQIVQELGLPMNVRLEQSASPQPRITASPSALTHHHLITYHQSPL